jgi:hypothetical protein
MTHLFQEKDISFDIQKHDYVQIVGKDEYKGYFGVVTGIYNNPNLLEPLYLIELQANGKVIQRPKWKLKSQVEMQSL